MMPKFFLGPMSKNIVDAVIEYSNENNCEIALIPSRRQVDFFGGYVNGWNTETFTNYVKEKSKNILLVRDHAGPNQGEYEDDGIESFKEDCKYFDVIHVDVWKKYPSYKEGLEHTIKFIKLGYSLNPKVFYEVGTEQSIREFTVSEVEDLISDLELGLSPNEYAQIKYVVIQSGTALKKNQNIGVFDRDKLTQMCEVVSRKKLISKEHNGDYLSPELVFEKFSLGLNTINIAPELGNAETSLLMDVISNNEKFVETLFEECYISNRWKKWVSEDFEPHKNKIDLINIAGHYVFSNTQVKEIKSKYENVDFKLKTYLKLKIKNFLEIEKKYELNLIHNYFSFFSKKDIESLSNLFDEQVVLTDWEIYSKGFDEVVTSNRKIFSECGDINIKVLNIFNVGRKYCCPIKIFIDSKIELDVVDIIELNSLGKIQSITAYKK